MSRVCLRASGERGPAHPGLWCALLAFRSGRSDTGAAWLTWAKISDGLICTAPAHRELSAPIRRIILRCATASTAPGPTVR